MENFQQELPLTLNLPLKEVTRNINPPSSQIQIDNLDELVSRATNCMACSLHCTRTNVVVHDGNPKARLMIVGEGPGEQEDLQGLPFVGRAGQLLNKMLEAVNIDRQRDTYICNVVKCRPPLNRVPSEAEAASCIGYLYKQIEFIKPKIILLLGATAVKYVLNIAQPKITKLHGIWIHGTGNLNGIEIMPFYHPSYLLRNPSKVEGSPKWQAWQAIKTVITRLNELN